MKSKTTLKILACALLSTGLSMVANGQAIENRQVNKAYWSNGIDGYILSSAINGNGATDPNIGTPRFTAFFHIGTNLNYDFNKNVGIFTGFSIKNIGFIEKFNNPDSTVKRRVYTFGIPLGFKFGNLKHGSYLIAGGGVDFPFNYKEKGFIDRGDKDKFNEWFSTRTPSVMPYFFIGAHLRPVMAIKLQYYPANFMNPNFSETIGGTKVYPYKDYNVQLLMLTFGFDINYRPRS